MYKCMEILVGEPAAGLLAESQQQQLWKFHVHGVHHKVFFLEDQESGETNFVEMHILTGDTKQQKVLPRWMPLVVREEVAGKLQKMQE